MVPYALSPYFHVSRASDLTGKDRILYRALEIMPGFLSWGTLILVIVLSAFHPLWVAVFIIAFDLYWLLKTVYLTLHHIHNWRRMKHMIGLDWRTMLQNFKYDHIYHMVILPYYKESNEVIETSIKAIIDAQYKKSRMIVVLAGEARAGDEARIRGEKIKARYAQYFEHFIVTTHPTDIPGDMPGKGSNISYAAEQARAILDEEAIPYKDVIVSAFDIDTVAYPQYFYCLTWHYLTVEDPLKVSFQPVPLYNNNVWEAPAISRVAAMSGTFWQMIQQERPEQNVTFSSHALSFQSLYDVGYWQRNMVSEDSRIFWNLFLARDGDYGTVSLSYPVSMDANLAGTLWQTLVNIYKQHRRWMWGVENIPYITFNLIKHPRIALSKKISVLWVQIEGFWSLSTNPFMILLLGWLPLMLGGKAFNSSVLSYNLPLMTQLLMTIAMSGLVLSAIISVSLLPKPPAKLKRNFFFWVPFVLQWVVVPVTLIVFGAIPGLEAQTRLMLGKYMGFWVTPKHRDGVSQDAETIAEKKAIV